MFYLNVTGATTPSPNCNTVPQCLATAGAAGGGTVVFPPGSFSLCQNWVFPDRVALVGAGRGRTLVQWPPSCQTASLFYPELNANTAKALPIISGAPGARWRMEDMDLHCQAKAALGYQPTLGTNFIGLGIASDLYNAGAGGYGGSSGRLARLNITFDLRLFPGVQIGNALAVYSSSDWSLVDSYVSHRGNCAAQWPHNCIYHVTNSSNGEVRGVELDMGCQAAAHESSSRLFLADNVYTETQSWQGQRSTTGGFEFSNIDPPPVSQLHYMGNISYTGNPASAERWESFTTDGGADCVYNDTVLGQQANPDGSATLTLASPVYPSVFFYHWAPGFAVTVMEGPNVGQQRRLLAVTGEDNSTMVINAPFDPPLTPLDYLSVNGYKGGYTLEGNHYFNATTFQVFGGLANSVFSGNTIDSMFASGKAVPPLPPMGSDMGGLAGGGGMQYAVSYQQELYNTWELNDFTCFDEFLISVFNFDYPSDNVPVQRKNATFNFAQVVRAGLWWRGISPLFFPPHTCTPPHTTFPP